MRSAYLSLLAGLFVVCGSQSAMGYLEFHKEWVKMYVDEEDESEENQEFVKLVTKGKTRCLVCHQGKKKKNHNPYGIHFLERLSKEDKKDEEKIVEALTEVGELPIDPEGDPDDTITYNELIERKEFPGGEVDKLMEEPEEDADDESENEESDDEE